MGSHFMESISVIKMGVSFYRKEFVPLLVDKFLPLKEVSTEEKTVSPI